MRKQNRNSCNYFSSFINSQLRDAQLISTSRKMKKSSPSHIIIKWFKINDKEKKLKSKEKRSITFE